MHRAQPGPLLSPTHAFTAFPAGFSIGAEPEEEPEPGTVLGGIPVPVIMLAILAAVVVVGGAKPGRPWG